jgi:uncharacterized heparinase superfamily protein
MTGAGTYWRTLRYLKPRQIFGRLVFRAIRPTLDVHSVLLRREGLALAAVPAGRTPSLIGPGRFRFLSVEHSIDGTIGDSPEVDKLWRYNLHYFDDLNAIDSDGRRSWHDSWIDRWVRENSPGTGTGWEPYPTSLRIVNWVKWFLRGAPARQEWLQSLAVQARWLRRRLEWHLMGNHLFANAKALIFAGLFFRGEEADEWRRKGLDILDGELAEQVLEDGGQFERSPMYHQLAFEDVLDLVAIMEGAANVDGRIAHCCAVLREAAARMRLWSTIMLHEDGTLPRFNDTADGVAPSVAALDRYAAELRLPVAEMREPTITLLRESGYVRMRWGNAVAFLDVAPVGPDYLPGHAHADTLSFEFSVGGRRVVVNRGTSCYGNSPRRAYERSTAAHSTVEVDGRDSSEVWGGFRVGRRARPRDLSLAGDTVSCTHDGYRFIAGSPLHTRHWQRMESGLRVEDCVTGSVPSVARYHLAPGLEAREKAHRSWRISSADGAVVEVEVEIGVPRVVPGLHAQGFGVLVPAQTLEIQLEGSRCRTRWTW